MCSCPVHSPPRPVRPFWPALALSAVLLVVPGVAAAQSITGVNQVTINGVDEGPSIRVTGKNLVIFDHRAGHISYPDLAVLQLPHDAPFVVRFVNTDPTKFDYTISPIDDATLTEAAASRVPGSATVATNALGMVHQSIIHDGKFTRYRVRVSLSSGTGATTTDRPASSPTTTSVNEALRLARSARGAAMDEAPTDSSALPDSTRELLVQWAQVEGMLVAAGALREESGALVLEILGLDREEPDPAVIRSLSERIAVLAARAEACPSVTLYSYQFDVFVQTVGARVDFNSGFAFSGLTDPKYYFNTESVQTEGETTTDTTDDKFEDLPVFRRDTAGEDALRPDLVAFVHTRPRWFQKNRHAWVRNVFKDFGFVFGLGTDGNSSTRYYAGISHTLGSRFSFSVGRAGGSVHRAPTGQAVGMPAIDGVNQQSLTDLPSRFATAWFAGVSFSFTDAEDKFLNSLKSEARSANNAATMAPTVEITKPTEGQELSAAEAAGVPLAYAVDNFGPKLKVVVLLDDKEVSALGQGPGLSVPRIAYDSVLSPPSPLEPGSGHTIKIRVMEDSTQRAEITRSFKIAAAAREPSVRISSVLADGKAAETLPCTGNIVVRLEGANLDRTKERVRVRIAELPNSDRLLEPSASFDTDVELDLSALTNRTAPIVIVVTIDGATGAEATTKVVPGATSCPAEDLGVRP